MTFQARLQQQSAQFQMTLSERNAKTAIKCRSTTTQYMPFSLDEVFECD